jgi:hypothetical protein
MRKTEKTKKIQKNTKLNCAKTKKFKEKQSNGKMQKTTKKYKIDERKTKKYKSCSFLFCTSGYASDRSEK